VHSPGDVLARPRANAPQWTIAFNTGLPLIYTPKVPVERAGIFGGFFNQRLIAMGKVLALGWAKRMQLNPAGLGTRCG
jgi:hypothetical protein